MPTATLPSDLRLVVTVVRHAETEQNAHVPRILQGQTDHPISHAGIKEAENLAWRLKKQKIDRIYTSDLQRAKQTAYAIAAHHPSAKIGKDPRLREQDLGDLSGMTWPTAKDMLKEREMSFDEYVALKGESAPAFKKRVTDLYTDLIEECVVERYIIPDEQAVSDGSKAASEKTTPSKRRKVPPPLHVLVVTHGGFVQGLFHYLSQDLGFAIKCDIPMGFPKPTSLWQFSIHCMQDTDGEDTYVGRITHMNDVSHMAGLTKRPGIKTSTFASPKASPLMLRRTRSTTADKKKKGLLQQIVGARVKTLGW
ncbi:histidine phosphatase superfamily [Gaertneriomyces semiglobifer]|nr:histidine phosphatase superfamily [Gaertneriomyces semiglobifer]